MSEPPGRDVAAAEEEASWAALADRYTTAAVGADEAAVAAWREVAAVLLGDLHDARLVDLEARVGVTGLLALREDVDDRIAAAQARRAVLVEMDEVAHASDVAARLEAELAAVQGRLADLERERALWEREPAFRKLAARGFFVEDYAPGWWGRWRDRRALDRVVAALASAGSGAPEPVRETVIAAYGGLVARVEGARAVAQRVEARRERQRALERERIALADAPTRLHRELCEGLAAILLAGIRAGGVELRYELAREEPEAADGFRRVDGLEARGRYLRALLEARVLPRVGEPVDDEAFVALDALWRTLVGFEAWERGGLGGHVLWWDVMTGGAAGEDLPEVREFLARWGGPVAAGHATAGLEAELGGARATARGVVLLEEADDAGDEGDGG